jgi:hypothetical protein
LDPNFISNKNDFALSTKLQRFTGKKFQVII